MGGLGAEPSTGSRRRFPRRSGSLRCCQVRFNRVPDKVPEKVLEKVGKALVQRLVRFNTVLETVLEKAPRRSGRLWCCQVRCNRVLEKVPDQVRARSGSETGFQRRWEALVQSQVRSNRFQRRLLEKV